MTAPLRKSQTWPVVITVGALVFALGVIAFIGARHDAGVLFFLTLCACTTSLQLGVWLGLRQTRERRH